MYCKTTKMEIVAGKGLQRTVLRLLRVSKNQHILESGTDNQVIF